MKDEAWHKMIMKCNKLAIEHRELLKQAEAEYERRYGNKPSDVDDDWWIDTCHQGNGSPDLDSIKKSAELHRDMHLK